MTSNDLQSTYLRLRADGSAQKLPVDQQFWARLASGELGDFHREYLVACSTHTADWPNWEMHPNGDEIVALLTGTATLVLEAPDGSRSAQQLSQPGSFVLVPRGIWHTAKLQGPATMLFITPGEGTQHRPA